jgi:AhpD family alkylhydroperoxidase
MALFSKTSLTQTERQVVYLTSNFENECHYCMAGHTQLAKIQMIDTEVVQHRHKLRRAAVGCVDHRVTHYD